MRILILNWRDIENPRAGGAEIYTHEVARRLARQGHSVTLLSAAFPGARKEDNIDGVRIIRRGSRWSVHIMAYLWYKRTAGNKSFHKFDAVIDEVNTLPFMTPLYIHEGPRLFGLFHQLCRSVWWYETFFPLNVLGYLAEPLYLRVYRNTRLIALSRSTEKDLLRYVPGNPDIAICPPGLDIEPVNVLPDKEDEPTFIFVGRLTKSKRPDHVIRAFKLIRNMLGTSQLWIVGDGNLRYMRKLEQLATEIGIRESVAFFGRLDLENRNDLMRRAHMLLMTSVKEGWGMVVTEAAALGTPAVVYDVDGLRDSVRRDETGVICKENTPESLAGEVAELYSDSLRYQRYQFNGLAWSKNFSWERTAKEFVYQIACFDNTISTSS